MPYRVGGSLTRFCRLPGPVADVEMRFRAGASAVGSAGKTGSPIGRDRPHPTRRLSPNRVMAYVMWQTELKRQA